MNVGALSVVFKFKSNGRLRFKSEHVAREGLISLRLWDADLDSNMSETLEGLTHVGVLNMKSYSNTTVNLDSEVNK